MSGLRVRIGGDGPVVAESDASGWRLLVPGGVYATGVAPAELHSALRDLALGDQDWAHDAFDVVMNCAGSWEDEYTEEHGEAALSFDGWMELIKGGGEIRVNDEGQLEASP